MRIGLLGFGVVGRGVYDLTASREDMTVVKVVCLEDVSLPDVQVTKNFQDVLDDNSIDTVVEAMGGLHPAYEFVKAAIEAVMPDEAVKKALEDKEFPGRVYLVSVGKAGWQMAKAAYELLGQRITRGMVVTKYDHVKAPIENCICYEAGHPVPDENSFRGTRAALELVKNLTETDTVLFLLSGGGSALFELPLIPGEQLQDSILCRNGKQ